jgi:hypothetical protein
VRIVHGLASFYRKFIRNFSGICAQMMDMVKKRHKYFKWTKEAERSFWCYQEILVILKENIAEQPILVLPNFEKTFQVRHDSSGAAIRSVLSQENMCFSYFSEKMNETKRKYSTYDK